MTPKLCSSCRSLPSELFQPRHDSQSLIGGPEIYLPPLSTLLQSATMGCVLCKIWTTNPSAGFVPDAILRHSPVRLRRSQIAPHMSITGFIGTDHIFIVHFSRVPRSWNSHIAKDLACRSHPNACSTSSPALRVSTVDDFEISLISSWLNTCRSQHSTCNNALQSATGGPSRLLDLEPFDESGDVRLIECESEAKQQILRFVCLSHCWGELSNRPKTTTKETLLQHLERIPHVQLSKTFQDAIRITRQVGERYLWIDSLCIVQDDPQDWEEQSARMPSIYGGATLTIAALSAEDGRGGCCVDPQIGGFVDIHAGSHPVRFFQYPPVHWHALYGDDKFHFEGHGSNPLRTRAWTLQERYLSTRNIHYANGVLLWECKTARGSSILPWSQHDPPDDFVPWPIPMSMNESSALDGMMEARSAWYEISEDYSGRFMTKESDKLPAFSGMAAKFSTRFGGDQYHAGLFRCHLPAALLWRSHRMRFSSNVQNVSHTVRKYGAFRPRRPMRYRAPSWSWAALDGAMSYDSQRLDNSGGARPNTEAHVFDFGLRVLDAQTCWRGKDPFGTIESSYLRVLGRTCVVNLQWARQNHIYNDDGWRLLTSSEGTVIGVVYPDIINELQFTQKLICLEVRSEAFWAATPLPHSVYDRTCSTREEWGAMNLVMGLALLPVQGCDRTFQRKGLIRWLGRHVFKDEPRELLIV